MKYFNYAILLLILIFLCTWVFNHISAWAGILFGGAIVYFVIWKAVNLIKEQSNEKN